MVLKPFVRNSSPFSASGVLSAGWPDGVDHVPAGAGHRLGEVDGEALVLVELPGVAADVADLGHLGAVGGQLGPGDRRLSDADLLQQVGAVVEQPGAGEPRRGEQPAAVLPGAQRGCDEVPGVQLVLVELLDPAVRGELRGPDGVEGLHVERVGLDLRVLDELLPLGVGGLGEFDHPDLLAGMGAVPAVDDLLQRPGRFLERSPR